MKGLFSKLVDGNKVNWEKKTYYLFVKEEYERKEEPAELWNKKLLWMEL